MERGLRRQARKSASNHYQHEFASVAIVLTADPAKCAFAFAGDVIAALVLLHEHVAVRAGLQ